MATYRTVTTCTNVNDFCAAYTQGTDYKCPGHTNRVSDASNPKYNGTTPAFSNYQAYSGSGSYTNANVIKSIDINTLRHVLQEEINLRKGHSLYASKIEKTLGADVQTGELVYHPQQNLVVEVMIELANAINSIAAEAGDTLNGKQPVPAVEQMVDTGEEIKVHHQFSSHGKTYKDGLKDIEEMLVPVLNDCICYSDCTDHKSTTKRVRVCTCNGNCGCVYW